MEEFDIEDSLNMGDNEINFECRDQVAETRNKIIELSNSIALLGGLLIKAKQHKKKDPKLSINIRNERIRSRNLCKEIESDLTQIGISYSHNSEALNHLSKMALAFKNLNSKFSKLDKDSQKMVSNSIFDPNQPSASLIFDDYDPSNSDNLKQAQKSQKQKQKTSDDWQAIEINEEEEMEQIEQMKDDMTAIIGMLKDFNVIAEQQQIYIDKLETETYENEIRNENAVREIATASAGGVGLTILGAVVGGLVAGPFGAALGAQSTLAWGVATATGVGVGVYAGKKINANKESKANEIKDHLNERNQQPF